MCCVAQKVLQVSFDSVTFQFNYLRGALFAGARKKSYIDLNVINQYTGDG